MRATASSKPQRPTAPLLGRERERAVIDALLDEAHRGVSGALVLRGEAGIGKSALLWYAVGQAASMTVLTITGVEAEADLAFAGLHGLLRPVLEHLGELPETQNRALAGALGLASSANPDRLLISAAVLGLLASAAEDRPVLCVIDDAQWVDRPSVDALVFTARRLRAERIAILAGAREGEGRGFEAGGLTELKLTGLDQASAAELLSVSGRTTAPAVRERLLAEAAGNPLALLELPAGLSQPQLEGRAQLPDAVPLTPRLESVFRQRIGGLPEASQTALLIVAADNTGDVPTVLRAMAGLQLPADVLDPAERTGLVHIEGRTIGFRHPLVRSALYQGATLSQRQAAHAALAGALAGEEHADRRVWHQAMATLTGDEEVAAALEASARRARLRAAHASAATAFLRAAELSTDEARRIKRIAAAAQAAWDAGQPDRAREAIGLALPAAGGEVRARLLHLSGVIEARTGSLRDACTILLEGADVTADPSLELEMLMDAAEATTFSGDLAKVVPLGERASRIPAASERDHFMQAVLAGFARFYAGENDEAERLFTSALTRAAALEDPRALVWAADAASTGTELGAGLPYANRAVDVARQQGMLSLLPLALRRQAMELLWNSQLDQAYAAAQEGYRLSLEVGYGSGEHLANMASLEAARGREEDARRYAEEAHALGQRRGSPFLVSAAEFTLGFIELTAGRAAAAADRLLALTALERSDVNPIIALSAIPDAVEAAVRADRHQEAADRVAVFRGWVTQAPTPPRRALLARSEALLGERPPPEAFAEAIEQGAALAPFQRARTELLFGEWLRRERRRQEARTHLRAALELFRGLGIILWEERAEAELRATGETARKRDPSTLDQLTPQELQIAGLVAEGLTNRDIAAQLYLSPRTIDYHLRKVFTKLGIGSRTELVRHGLAGYRPA
jgi:DNA-binding CsgD family transcriptional regulator